MNSDDKENKVPNQSKSIFSNSIIKKIQKIRLHSPQSIGVGQKQRVSIQSQECPKHTKLYSNMFCAQCLTYNLCSKCVQTEHQNHEIMKFSCTKQMLSETKQILLQSLQQTLKNLKSKQNDVKNRTHEINLVRNSLRTLQQEIVGMISGLFRQIQSNLFSSLQKNQNQFNQEIDVFFNGFNQTNDELRQNLMKILQEQIKPLQFKREMICIQAPQSPNFMVHKSILQKYKKVLKDIKNEMEVTKKILFEGCNYISGNISKNLHNSNNSITKFDKYIDKNIDKKVNQSFLKTLKLIETSQKSNLILNNCKSQTKIGKRIF